MILESIEHMQYYQFDFNTIAARRVCLKDTLLLFVEFCVSFFVFMLAESIYLDGLH